MSLFKRRKNQKVQKASDEGRITVTSHNQTGGITAHTVHNHASPGRHMSADFGAQLQARIPAGAYVEVTALFGDPEAYTFAKEALAWLLANGYPNAKGINQAVPVPVGQNVSPAGNGYQLVIGSMQ